MALTNPVPLTDFPGEQPLTIVIDRPAGFYTGNAVYIGPTKVDMQPVEEHEAKLEKVRRQQARDAAIRKRENGMLKRWRLKDDRHYRGPGWNRPHLNA